MTSDLDLDLAANGRAVTLVLGQRLRLRLAENPTTGYQWAVLSSDDLVLESNRFTPVGTAVGGGGTRELRWQASCIGSNQITLAQRRTWEPIEKSLARFTLTVVVTRPEGSQRD